MRSITTVRRHLPRAWPVVLIALVVAIPLMHVVVAVCADHGRGSHAVSPTHVDHTAHAQTPNTQTPNTPAPHTPTPGVPTLTAVVSSADDSMGPGDHCDAHGHPCSFVRADDADPPVVVLVLLVWAFLLAAGLCRRGFPAVHVLGRPPPWAIRTHLELQVIRC